MSDPPSPSRIVSSYSAWHTSISGDATTVAEMTDVFGAASSTRGYARTPSARSRREKSQVACPVAPAYTPTMVTLRIPEDVLSTLGPDPEAAAGELRVLAAMKLFELGRVSSGAAAAIAGMPRVGFLAKLGEYGVSPFQVTPADLEHDLDVARRAARD
jgi:predicted HTH domain antitoxin